MAYNQKRRRTCSEYYQWAIKELKHNKNSILKKIMPKNDREWFYYITYPLILDFFKKEKNKGIIKYALAYSWMPTVPKMPLKKPKSIEDKFMWEKEFNETCQRILNSIDKIKDKIEGHENGFNDAFEELKKLINGSDVGASKFLHFQYPKVFPMWDTDMIK